MGRSRCRLPSSVFTPSVTSFPCRVRFLLPCSLFSSLADQLGIFLFKKGQGYSHWKRYVEMLQRAASNAYSWWWASHIRTKQSKWLDSNLHEMEEMVKKMLKLIEADADSFAKRAELYFKRRPELIGFVQDAYRAYRALAERYDHISGELHKANHTIATACPDQVQYAMLEEDDNLPKAIVPIDPSKINKPLVEGLMNKRRESESSINKQQKKTVVPQISKEKAQEEISKLQKEILVLQTEKEFIKSSYESGIAKYWDIEKQIMDMHEKVSQLQDEFSTGAVISDNEARSLMTATALKSCEDAMVNLQEQRRKSLEQAKVESERIKVANEKLKTLKSENGQLEVENAEMSGKATQMSFSAEKIEDDALNKARLNLQSICEKTKMHFEMIPESSVIEIAEKINELANKVFTLEMTVSSQCALINQLTSENNELDRSLQKLEEEKMTLINDSNALSKRLKEAEEGLTKVQAIEKIIHDEEFSFRESFAETCHNLSNISEKLQSFKATEDGWTHDAFIQEESSTLNTEPGQLFQGDEITEINVIKDDLKEEIHATQEHGNCQEDASQTEAGSQLKGALEMTDVATEAPEINGLGSSQINSTVHLTTSSEILPDGKDQSLTFCQNSPSGLDSNEVILEAEYTTVLTNNKETNKRLSEIEKKNDEHIQDTMTSLIAELKNIIVVKDEEIQMLQQKLASPKTGSVLTVDSWHGQQKVENTSDSSMCQRNYKPQDSDTADVPNPSSNKSDLIAVSTEKGLAGSTNADHINDQDSISPIAEKFRRDIDTLIEGNFEFWLRFSTSFHHMQELKSKYEDLQTDISKLNNKASAEDSPTADQAWKSESAPIATRLRELKTELGVWLEESALLRGELQSRISSLSELQEEISIAMNTKMESVEILFTPCEAAKFNGEVMNMKQENTKAISELQLGQDQVKKLQAEIEDQLFKSCEKFEPFPPGSPHDPLDSPPRARVPLRVFLFGAKPKKPSFFERIQPVFQKQNMKLRVGRRSKQFAQSEE